MFNNHLVRSCLYFSILFLSVLQSAWGQILDDSTKNIYGFQSVGSRKLSAYYKNDTLWQRPDSSLKTIQQLLPMQEYGWRLQDLGNAGTAARFITPNFESNVSVARQLGYNVFKPYKTAIEEVNYYQTRSPYTLLRYAQHGRGYGNFRFIHAQNITPLSNIAVDIHRISASKQIAAGSFRETRLIDSWNATLSGTHLSKSKKYEVAAHYNIFNHRQVEQGGIDYVGELKNFYVDSVALYGAKLKGDPFSREIESRAFLFHHIKLNSGLSAYQEVAYAKGKYQFTDNQFTTNSGSGAYVLAAKIGLDSVNIFSQMSSWKNTVGLKGNWRQFEGKLYSTQRLYRLINRSTNSLFLPTQFEFLVGGQAAWMPKFLGSQLQLEAEINPIKLYYQVNGSFNIQRLAVKASSRRVPVDIFPTYFVSSAYNWNNQEQFNSLFINQLQADYLVQFKNWHIAPHYDLHSITNFTYYDETSMPKQASQTLALQQVGINGLYKNEQWNIRLHPLVNLSFNQSIFPMPRVEVLSQVEKKFSYINKLPITVGMELVYKSAYKAPMYNPLLQQFYIQNKYSAWGNWVADAYLKFNVNKVKLAFRYGNLNQRTAGILAKSYFPTPFYPALRRTLLLGVEWPLFD